MQKNRIPLIAMLSALALVFGYIESLLPVVAAIPGIKLGISNIVILFAIYRLNIKSAFFIMLIKVMLSALLFSGLNVLVYSLCGGLLSLALMAAFKNRAFSIIGISMLGGICHNVGQLAAAAFMLSSGSVFYYFPVLLFSGIILGAVTGTVCKIILSRLKSVRI